MHAKGLLQRLLVGAEVIAHASRREALLKAVDSLLGGHRLSVTMLGRGLNSGAEEKHRIKSVDDLLRNPRLHAERLSVYRMMTSWVVRTHEAVVVEVDWSDTGHREVQVLRAAVALRGRSFVLWEEVYPQSEYNQARSHREFLRGLEAVLGRGREVVIVTDAGFRATWYRLVESMGWRWFGRVRSQAKYQQDRANGWVPTATLHALADSRERALGEVWLNKNGPYRAQLFLGPRPNPTRRGPRRNAEDYRASRSHREPWVLAGSPGLGVDAPQAMALYAKRMQIEQSFRDLKNPRHGFGLRYSASTQPQRVAVLLLIAALATFAQWLYGLVAERQGWTRRYQANTERARRVLSVVYVGARVIRTRTPTVTVAMLQRALRDLAAMVTVCPVSA